MTRGFVPGSSRRSRRPRSRRPTAARRAALGQLIAAEEFDNFLAVKWPTKKRFGGEGADALAPLLHRLIEKAAGAGVTDIVIGPMHRGRLNLMANVFGEPLVELIAKFKGAHPFPGANGLAADVPYHLGFEGKVATAAGPKSRSSVVPNPSHLEAVNPVVLGRVRALQDDARREADGAGKILGIILHTDASVIAQGSIAEMIQLSGLEGYATGGTIHVIVNNQIGFTTEPHEARTSLYCTGAWKAIDSAILHVNGNDADAVIRAADLAFDFRRSASARRRDRPHLLPARMGITRSTSRASPNRCSTGGSTRHRPCAPSTRKD